MRVRFIAEVTAPLDCAGQVGDVKELPDSVAYLLRGARYVVFVEDDNESGNTGSTASMPPTTADETSP